MPHFTTLHGQKLTLNYLYILQLFEARPSNDNFNRAYTCIKLQGIGTCIVLVLTVANAITRNLYGGSVFSNPFQPFSTLAFSSILSISHLDVALKSS